MPITDQKYWDNQVKINKDGYGGACIKTARRVMEILDEETGELDTHKIICRADDESGAGGITGFQAGCVAQIVMKCHSRGNEFRVVFNTEHGVTEEKAKGGIVNPAVFTIGEAPTKGESK